MAWGTVARTADIGRFSAGGRALPKRALPAGRTSVGWLYEHVSLSLVSSRYRIVTKYGSISKGRYGQSRTVLFLSLLAGMGRSSLMIEIEG